jgi:hypothetical protein
VTRWHSLVIPALRRPRQEDCELEAVLGFTVRHCLKNNNPTTTKKRKKKHE